MLSRTFLMMLPLDDFSKWAEYGCKDNNPCLCQELKLTDVVRRLYFSIRLCPVFSYYVQW
jgi:hypothetical protein